VTKPLELHGENHRVRFGDPDSKMLTHEMTLKLQAAKVSPLDLQFVVDVIPKLMITARKKISDELEQKPTTKAYLHLGAENQTDADKLLVLAFMANVIVSSGGRLASKERITLFVEETAKRLANEISYATFSALEKLTEAREGILQEAQA
jgi:hypothetical protein